jgi:hypothetical protein
MRCTSAHRIFGIDILSVDIVDKYVIIYHIILCKSYYYLKIYEREEKKTLNLRG